MDRLNKLIRALQIFATYDKPKYPTRCVHNIFYVLVKPDLVSDEDTVKLYEMGFVICEEHECFGSYAHGYA